MRPAEATNRCLWALNLTALALTPFAPMPPPTPAASQGIPMEQQRQDDLARTCNNGSEEAGGRLHLIPCPAPAPRGLSRQRSSSSSSLNRSGSASPPIPPLAHPGAAGGEAGQAATTALHAWLPSTHARLTSLPPTLHLTRTHLGLLCAGMVPTYGWGAPYPVYHVYPPQPHADGPLERSASPPAGGRPVLLPATSSPDAAGRQLCKRTVGCAWAMQCLCNNLPSPATP
jgi:hypothetical protein